jgi:hypothetical protein
MLEKLLPLSWQCRFIRPGVSSTSVFFSVTFPETGVYNSEAAFTLSRAPHSPDAHKTRVYFLDNTCNSFHFPKPFD